jgi:hypothetical protein
LALVVQNGGSSSQLPGLMSTGAASPSMPQAAEAQAAPGLPTDELMDHLGPLEAQSVTSYHHELQQQLQQQQSRDTGGVVRQVAVGIITLEDVIEELMQVGDMLLQ